MSNAINKFILKCVGLVTNLGSKRLTTNPGFVDFRDYFGRFSILFAGVVCESLIQLPQKKVEKQLKRTRKSTEAGLWSVSKFAAFLSPAAVRSRRKNLCTVVVQFVNLFAAFGITSLFSAEEKEEIVKISETMGHLIGKNLQSLGLPLDLEALVKGMQDEASGKASPLADEEYEKAIVHLQETSHEKAAVENLQAAMEFLQKNELEEGVISLEKGKLQYKVVKMGEGKEVQSYNTPLIRYQGRALNGELLQPDYEEELVSLDEALIGLKQGIVGMKEGERRTLYIHPELAYGKESYAPNALLIFDVEVIKADTSAEVQAVSDAETLPVQAPLIK